MCVYTQIPFNRRPFVYIMYADTNDLAIILLCNRVRGATTMMTKRGSRAAAIPPYALTAIILLRNRFPPETIYL